LAAAFAQQGAAAFAHGNRGRPSARRISDELREQVRQLGSARYAGCNDTHFTELLLLDHGIDLSRKSVQRIRRQAGQPPKRRRRPPRHRSRRDRLPREGMLLQIDASLHHWFGPEQPRLTLVGAIDDATGKVSALFRQQEDAQGYFLLLRQVLRSEGVPLALYRDRHGIFQVNPQTPVSLEQQLQGRDAEPTQFGRALAELGIDSIAAHSPEAKGRIERLWGTLQDRLVAELELAGVQDIRGAFRYQRVVARDNTVSLEGRLIQIPPGPRRRSYAGARVWVNEFLDGSLGVWYQDEWLARGSNGKQDALVRARKRRPELPERLAAIAKPLPLEASPDKVTTLKSGAGWKPGANHPWRTPLMPNRARVASRTESLSS
jgi:hypothetical protein